MALSLFHELPLFLDPKTPFQDASIDLNCGLASIGSMPQINPYIQIVVFSGEYVKAFAHLISGDYWMIFVIILTYLVPFPGAALSSYFLPGHNLPIAIVALTAILSAILLS